VTVKATLYTSASVERLLERRVARGGMKSLAQEIKESRRSFEAPEMTGGHRPGRAWFRKRTLRTSLNAGGVASGCEMRLDLFVTHGVGPAFLSLVQLTKKAITMASQSSYSGGNATAAMPTIMSAMASATRFAEAS